MDNQIIRVMRARRILSDGTGRRIRESAGLSVSEIACELGVSPAAVCRWESGDRAPRTEFAARYEQLISRIDRATRVLEQRSLPRPMMRTVI